jgi:pyruvate/2-oxoglutarate/acetoin dehydrogenase E1 component
MSPSNYRDELTRAMTFLGQQPDTIFIGQQMLWPGNGLYATLQGVPLSKRIEVGVAEDMQMGIAIGYALAGRIPVCIYPRMDFMLCALNQIANHLENYPDLRVIIRTCVGSKTPLDPGPQHSGNYTEGLRHMLRNVGVIELLYPDQIFRAYEIALGTHRDRYAEAEGCKHKSYVLVEKAELYGVV